MIFLLLAGAKSSGSSALAFAVRALRPLKPERILMPDVDVEAVTRRLAELKQEHRDLDQAIAALVESGAADQLQVQRLKKRKLRLKDQIRQIEDLQLPNIIA